MTDTTPTLLFCEKYMFHCSLVLELCGLTKTSFRT